MIGHSSLGRSVMAFFLVEFRSGPAQAEGLLRFRCYAPED